MPWCFLNGDSCLKNNALFIQLLWYMQHLITHAANTSNILNVELFWHVIWGVILGSHILIRHSLRFNVLLMCTSPQRSQQDTISCIWLIMHHKVTDALYVDGLIPASSFVPRVCCLWRIQQPRNLSTRTSLLCRFSEGASLPPQDRLNVHVPMWRNSLAHV